MEYLDPILSVFADFADPKKRVFVGYLFLSLLIAFVWLIAIRKNSADKARAKIFDRKVFFSGSAKADYKIFVLNQLFTLVVSPLLLTQLAIATAIYFWLHGQNLVPQGVFGDAPTAIVVAIFSVTMFVVDDFTKYLLHRWMHRFPFLWAIHKVHHSAKTLTPVTVYRVHPLEGILYGLRSTVAQGTVLPAFIFLFGSTVDLYTIVGVNVLVFIFHVTGSNLRHSHINISYWPWLEHILISPAQHQIHHSIAEEHFDRNFGAALAIWDWAFGSLHVSDADQELEFGLDKSENSSEDELKVLYLQPVLEIWSITAGYLSKLTSPLTAWRQ
ncbi:MAG: sterol desaturase family protein [Pseudomonadota bacterium]